MHNFCLLKLNYWRNLRNFNKFRKTNFEKTIHQWPESISVWHSFTKEFSNLAFMFSNKLLISFHYLILIFFSVCKLKGSWTLKSLVKYVKPVFYWLFWLNVLLNSYFVWKLLWLINQLLWLLTGSWFTAIVCSTILAFCLYRSHKRVVWRGGHERWSRRKQKVAINFFQTSLQLNCIAYKWFIDKVSNEKTINFELDLLFIKNWILVVTLKFGNE